MQNLVWNPIYFPQSAATKSVDALDSGSPLPAVVRQVVSTLLGEKAFRGSNPELDVSVNGSVFDILTLVLPPMPSRAAFWWDRLGKPFASMMVTAAFTVELQARFLIFVYTRVLGFMGPEDEAVGPGSYMTAEGSPVELSWVILDRSKPRPGEVTRQLRFCIEPRDPETGFLYKGTSTGLQKLRIFCVPSQTPISIESFNTDKLLDQLGARLHPALTEPLETVRLYTHRTESLRRPFATIAAVDCVEPDANRLKIYFRGTERTSWPEARMGFTLNGALENSPEVAEGQNKMELLWNYLFPNATSAIKIDVPVVTVPAAASGDNRPVHSLGLLFYYEFYANDHNVYPKIYLPVQTYCKNDLAICHSVEKFYNDIGVKGPECGERGEGWVAREVVKSFGYRKLETRCGIITYVTLGAKKGGWEVTMYFTPEPWAAERK
ncbi:tryptophan dimethylallyltransferase-domain-containing protein [Mycena albidolilacea]|uniref:Tryptophan dimethylallyltransferase-domain-containing protein n=1 Tax=Mycena albidolilacea TaxID=1033008 RepID=A0AAD7ATG8_9AGAR|nr:tryptophan dimethylallyltransferase-domain-containing protein [Mycena albidolilacea]